MSEPLQDEVEVIDGLPVPAGESVEASALSTRRSHALAVTLVGSAQAAAVAAGGFVAGAAFVGLVHRRYSRRRAAPATGRSPLRLGRTPKRPGAPVRELVQIVGTRSLLVDVHLLGSPGADR